MRAGVPVVDATLHGAGDRSVSVPIVTTPAPYC
jgi:hypothetical protein